MRNTTLKEKQTQRTVWFAIGWLAMALFAVLVSLPYLLTPAKHQTTAVLVGSDYTEAMLAHPNPEEIIAELGIDDDPNNGGSVGFFDLTDVSLNARTTFSLPKEPGGMQANPFTRKRAVQHFRSEITSFLDTAGEKTVGKNHSSIFIPMAEALNELARDTADNRVFILYSDLYENDLDISFYNPQTLAMLRSNPDRVAEILLAKAPLGNLSNVAVVFVYQPKDAKDDDSFRLVSGFYKTLLEQHGATVSIRANLTQ